MHEAIEEQDTPVKSDDANVNAIFFRRRVRRLSEFSRGWCRWASMVFMVLAFVSVLAKFALLSTFPELRMMETIGFIRPGISSTMQQNMVSEGGSNYLTQIQESSRSDCYFFLHFFSCHEG